MRISRHPCNAAHTQEIRPYHALIDHHCPLNNPLMKPYFFGGGMGLLTSNHLGFADFGDFKPLPKKSASKQIVSPRFWWVKPFSNAIIKVMKYFTNPPESPAIGVLESGKTGCCFLILTGLGWNWGEFPYSTTWAAKAKKPIHTDVENSLPTKSNKCIPIKTANHRHRPFQSLDS